MNKMAKLEKKYDDGKISFEEYTRIYNEQAQKAAAKREKEMGTRSHNVITWNAKEKRWDM